MPGERYEVIIDFTGFANTTLVMNNTGRTPYPGGVAPQGTTLGKIMQFRVGAAVADASYNPATLAPLRSGTNAIVRLTTAGTPPAAPAKTRSLTLNEVMGMPVTAVDPVTGILTPYPGGPLEILVNNTKWSGERITGVDTTTGMAMYTMAPIPGFTLDGAGKNWVSELPQEGDTEVWEVINLTADAHPIHLHLVQFQLINRQNFDAAKYSAAYNARFPGGGFDPMTGLPYPAGVYIPGFGPPLAYAPTLASGPKYGGNPDVTPFLKKGAIGLPLPQEQGWKDTVIMFPGQVTRIAVRWAPTHLPANTAKASLNFPFDTYSGGMFNYVWHCHIIDHEDNEMMRPDMVTLNPLAPAPALRPLVKGIAY
jgi:FtsP/CotA-like multicopper oxidase with cupredoxin domain